MKLALCGLISGCFAQALAAEADSYPRLQYTDQEIQIAFSRDQVAVVSSRQSRKHEFTTELKLTSDTCNKQSESNRCEIVSWFDYAEFGLIWKQHPDPAKVGQAVTRSSKGRAPLRQVLDWSMRFMDSRDQKRFILSKNLANAVPHRMQCQKDGWFPQGATEIPEVSFEIFSTGLETDLRDIRSVQTFSDVKFKKNGSTVEWQSMRPFHVSDNRLMNAFANTFVSKRIQLTFKKDEQACQVVFSREVNPADALKLIYSDMAKPTPVKFPDLDQGIDQLSADRNSQLAMYDAEFSVLKKKQLSKVDRVLEAFSLVRVFYKVGTDGSRYLNLEREQPL